MLRIHLTPALTGVPTSRPHVVHLHAASQIVYDYWLLFHDEKTFPIDDGFPLPALFS